MTSIELFKETENQRNAGIFLLLRCYKRYISRGFKLFQGLNIYLVFVSNWS